MQYTSQQQQKSHYYLRQCETWQFNLGYSLPLSVSFNYNSITSPIWISPYGHSAIPWLHKDSGMEYLASAEGRGRKLKAVFFLCLVEVDWFFVNKVMCNDTGFSYQLSCRDSQWAHVQCRAVLLLQRLFLFFRPVVAYLNKQLYLH